MIETGYHALRHRIDHLVAGDQAAVVDLAGQIFCGFLLLFRQFSLLVIVVIVMMAMAAAAAMSSLSR